MTDYRLRNHDLLYADRRRQPLTWRNLAIFGSIAVTVTFGVVSYLTDRFNPAGAGFNPSSFGLVAQQKAAPTSAVHLATPSNGRSGS